MSAPQSLFAQGTLPEENVRALDQLRQRLQQMSTSLNVLKTELGRTETLPTWDSLQTRAGLLAADLQQLQTIFDANRNFLTTAHPYPHASFPGYSAEPVLQQLLRKKAEPAVEAWIEDNTNPAKVAKWDNGAETGLQEDEQQELWAFARSTNEQFREHVIETGVFDFDYSLAEKKAGMDRVVTGLRRKLHRYLDDDEDDTEDYDDDEVMGEDAMPAAKPPNDPFGGVKGVDTSKPALPIEAWLKYMSIMALPEPDKRTAGAAR